MKKTLAILFCFSIVCISFAQKKRNFFPSDIDSLTNVLKTQKDTFAVNTLINLSMAVVTVDPKKSIAYCYEAIEKSEKIDFKRGELKGYNNLGGVYLKISDFKESKRYLDTTLLLAKKSNNHEYQVRGLQNYGNYFYFQQQFDSAINRYQIALKIAQEFFHDTITYGKLYNNMAGCYNLSGNYPQSVHYYLQSLKLTEAYNDKEGSMMASGNIGTVYFYMKNYQEAERYMLKALEMSTKVNNKYQASANHLNLGVVYKDTKRFEKAEEEFQKSLILKREINDRVGQGMILVNIGDMYTEKLDYVNALKNFKEAEVLAIELKHPQIELYSYTCQAKIYSAKGDYKNASLKFESGIAIAERLGLKPDLIEGYKSYSEASAKAKQFEKAFKYHQLYSSLKDSIYSSENQKVIAEMNTKYDSEKKQSEIELLNKDKEKQEALSIAERKKQLIIIASVSFGLFLVLIFAFFVYRSNRQKERANVEITLQKEIIEEKQKEILDSIHYARRIQRSLLPTEKYIQKSIDKLKK